MYLEAGGAFEAVRAQLDLDADDIARIATEIRRFAPRAVVTCARGSSDHAATYAKYLIETHAGVLTASAAPSVSSVYAATPDLHGCLFLAVSQSGRSPDLLATAAAAKRSGALVLALCNTPDSPLCALADLNVPLRAGAEKSVAATKSYLATLAALARLVAAWTRDVSLNGALATLPELLQQAWSLDWSAAMPVLGAARNLFVIGRGLGLGAAQEIALKCKETCALHAEAFSSAEVQHGPYALAAADFPALLLAQRDASLPGVEELARELVQRRVPVLLAGARAEGATLLPSVASVAEIGPILIVQTAYRMISQLALVRGLDPDNPPHLRKVTETV